MKRNLLIAGAAVVLVGALLALRPLVSPDPLSRLHRDGDAWSGSVYFPRGGPYVLGFESAGSGELAIDGRVVASGTREVIAPGPGQGRLIYEAGVHAIRFRAAAGGRLLWHPPGRRGPAEYLPASSLSPLPASAAGFDDRIGTSRADGAIAAAIVLVLLAAGLLMARPRITRETRPDAYLLLGVFALALVPRLAGISAGQTWDEDVYWSAGRNYVENLLRLDLSAWAFRANFEHPPVAKYLAGLGALLSDGYGPARAVFALLGAGAAALVAAIGNRLWGRRVALLAGIGAALTPHLIAHSRVVGLETPTVFLWALAILLVIGPRPAAADRPAASAGRLAAVGVVLGLAVGVRFANLLLLPLAGLVLVLAAPAGRRLRTILIGGPIVAAAAAVTFFLLWPRLWSDPAGGLEQAWRVLKKPHLPEYYLGVLVGNDRTPWHYFLVYFAATAPVGLLVAALPGLGRAARAFLRGDEERLGFAVVLLWLAAPFAIGLSPVRQDGMRYVLHAVPALILLGAVGLDWVLRPRVIPGAIAFAVYLVVVCGRIHPFYLDYYGEHVGGPGRADRARLFEISWWGEGLERAVDHINRVAPPGARVARLVHPGHLTWLRADLWPGLLESPDPRADFLLVNRQWEISRGGPYVPPPEFKLEYEVKAQGAVLARVYSRVP